jgi:hypothetical protein
VRISLPFQSGNGKNLTNGKYENPEAFLRDKGKQSEVKRELISPFFSWRYVVRVADVF